MLVVFIGFFTLVMVMPEEDLVVIFTAELEVPVPSVVLARCSGGGLLLLPVVGFLLLAAFNLAKKLF